MKTIEEALYLRNHILLTLEEAARNKDIKQAEKLQNIVIAGVALQEWNWRECWRKWENILLKKNIRKLN